MNDGQLNLWETGAALLKVCVDNLRSLQNISFSYQLGLLVILSRNRGDTIATRIVKKMTT